MASPTQSAPEGPAVDRALRRSRPRRPRRRPAQAGPAAGARPAAYDSFRDRAYFPGLDGVRAVAVVAVVAFHVGVGRPYGALHALQGSRGVAWFFALSGFLITTLALREEEERGTLDLRRFFVRRFFRIVPLYALAVACAVAADVLLLRDEQAVDAWAAYWPYYVTFLQDLPFVLRWPGPPFVVVWSLGVEEKFYVAWPLVGFTLLRRHRIPAAFALAVAAGTAMAAWHGETASRLARPYLQLLSGCLVALALHERQAFERLARVARPPALALVAGLAVAPAPGPLRGAVWYQAAGAAAAALVVGAVAVAPRPPLLSSAVARWVGRRSYGIYLFHTLVLRGVEKSTAVGGIDGSVAGAALLAGTLGVSLVVADVVHRFVERPFIRLGRRLRPRPWEPCDHRGPRRSVRPASRRSSPDRGGPGPAPSG